MHQRVARAVKLLEDLGLLAALVLVSALTLAAGGDDWAKRKAELSLSDAQVSQLQEKFKQLLPLHQKAMTLKKDLEVLEKAAPPDQKAIDAKKYELEALKKEWKPKVDAIYKSVLTPEQMHKMEEMQEKYQKEEAAKKK